MNILAHIVAILNDVLMERDPLHWIVLAGQIHLEVLRQMEDEIQR